MNNQIGNKINDKTYIPLPPFKGWVLENFPFIEDDFDCLTNYQMLCLMFKKLNEVIANQNTVQELGSELVVLYNALVDAVNSAINEFETEVTADINQFKIDTNTEISNFETFITGKFNELKDYVDNFFDNNFPEMVSDKLDEMATDGTLENLLNDVAHLTKSYNTYTEMMSDSSTFTNGLRIQTLGYYSVNDGGGALYQVSIENNVTSVNLISDVNNILCHGVSLTDANNNNHTIIRNVLNTYKYAYCNKDFVLHNTLNIDIANVKFDFQKLTYDGNNNAIIIDNANNVINGLTLTSAYDGLRLGSQNLTYNNKININEITAENNALIIGGAVGVYSNTFDVNKLNYKNHGVYFDLSTSYAGQIGFYNTAFNDLSTGDSDNYAIYMDCSNNDMTGLDMYNITFEGTKGGLYVMTTSYHFLEHLHIYGIRLGELSVSKRKKALKLVSSDTGCKINGNIDFDEVISDAFDLTEYHSYSQNSLVFNGSFRRQGSSDLLATKGIANYGGVILVNYPRQVTPINAGDQTLTNVYDRINVGNGTGFHIKINIMPNNNELFASPFRVYIAGSNVTRFNLVTGSNNTGIYQENCSQGDMFEIIPAARHYEYGFDIIVNHYKHSDNTISVFRISI